MHFKKDFVQELIQLLPDNIKKIPLVYPDIQYGHARFNKDQLDSIYLEHIRDEKDNDVTLKFQYRDFHYVSKSFIFKRLYFTNDGSNEYGFDKDLNINAKYLKIPSMLASLSLRNKVHVLGVLNEWWGLMRLFQNRETDYYIEAYQIEKDGEQVRIPYINYSPEVKHEELVNNYRFKNLNNYVEGLNFEDCGWFCKGSIDKDFKVTLDKNAIYVDISNVNTKNYYSRNRNLQKKG
jgi:hypothetical protein